jgi:hypothetical protein
VLGRGAVHISFEGGTNGNAQNDKSCNVEITFHFVFVYCFRVNQRQKKEKRANAKLFSGVGAPRCLSP